MHGNNPQSHTLRLGFLLAQRHLQEDMKALCKLLRESIQDRAEFPKNTLGVRTGTKGENYWEGVESIRIINIWFLVCFLVL